VLVAIGTATSTIAPAFAQDQESAAASFERGRLQYQRTCAQCHGRNLVNAGVTTYDLRKFPDDQRDRFLQSVTKGRGNMPAYEGALDATQIDGLWAYVSRRGKAPE
jgi:cytochrome c6